MSAIRELMHLKVRKLRFPAVEFLLPKRDVPASPYDECGLVRKGRAPAPDRAQPLACADNVARQRGVRGARIRRRERIAIVGHDFGRQDIAVADRFRHYLVHENVVVLDEVLSDPTRHQKTERPEVKVVIDRPAPGVGDHDPFHPVWMPAREIEADWPAPIRHEQGQVAKVEMTEQGGETVRMAFRMVVFGPFAS